MKKIVKELVRNEKGQALIIVLAFLAIGGLTIATSLTYMTTGIKVGQVHEKKMNESYAADAGVEYGLWQLTSGGLELTEGQQTTLSGFVMNNATVNTTIQRLSGVELPTYIINSTASGNSSSTTIESYIYIGNLLFTFGLASDGDIDLGNNNVVTGDIYIDDDGTLTTGFGFLHSGNVINGGLDFPSQEENDEFAQKYKDEALAGGNWTGNYSIPMDAGVVTLGPLYISGNLNIAASNTVNMTGTIYVEGSIDVDKDAAFTGSGSIVAVGDIYLAKLYDCGIDDSIIIASLTGNITFKKEGDITAVIYAPNGTVVFDKDASVTGSIVAAEIQTAKDYASAFNTSVIDLELPGASRPHIKGWKIN